jgi:hypothetical protein
MDHEDRGREWGGGAPVHPWAGSGPTPTNDQVKLLDAVDPSTILEGLSRPVGSVRMLGRTA